MDETRLAGAAAPADRRGSPPTLAGRDRRPGRRVGLIVVAGRSPWPVLPVTGRPRRGPQPPRAPATSAASDHHVADRRRDLNHRHPGADRSTSSRRYRRTPTTPAPVGRSALRAVRSSHRQHAARGLSPVLAPTCSTPDRYLRSMSPWEILRIRCSASPREPARPTRRGVLGRSACSRPVGGRLRCMREVRRGDTPDKTWGNVSGLRAI